MTLYADLTELRIVARVEFPHLEDLYSRTNHQVAGTEAHDGNAFGGILRSPIEAAFQGLRDQFRNALGRVEQTLEGAGQVLDHIVEVYKATDSESAAGFSLAWGDGGTATIPPQVLDSNDDPLPGPIPPVVIK
jgi:hypothetical protein